MLPNVLQPNTTDHVPVLADEVRALLALEPGHPLVEATFGAGGHLRSSRPVTRTATFVFYISDRTFGVVTAFVQGPRAGDCALRARVYGYSLPECFDSAACTRFRLPSFTSAYPAIRTEPKSMIFAVPVLSIMMLSGRRS